MSDQQKTRQQLISENERLRQRLAAHEGIQSQRSRAEQELARHKAMLQAAIDCLPFNFFAIGLDGRYMLQNAVSRAQQGGDAIGKLPEEVCSNMHDLAIYRDNNRRAFAGEKVEGEVALSLGGEERFYCNIVAPIRDGEQLHGILGVNIDITERKRAEEALRKARDELEQRVEERTAQLSRANERLMHEVEERRRAEDALRQSEEKYRTLVEMSPDAVLMTDLEGHVTYASQQAVKMHGSQGPDGLLGRNPLDFFAPEDHEKFLVNLQRNAEHSVLRNMEYTFLRTDGSRFAGEASAAMFRDEAGNPAGFVSIVRDITARKRDEEALRQSNDELQAIYDGMVEGLLITDIETKQIRRVNSSFCRMLGYGEDELLRKSTSDLYPPEEAPDELTRPQTAAGDRGSLNEDRPIMRKDGSVLYANVMGRRILYEGRPCMLALFRDITERRRARAALERERHTLEYMLRASDHERRLISYDIHDGLAQELAGAIMHFQIYAHARQANPENAAKAFDSAMAMLQQSHVEARRLISGVRPPILDESGVIAAIAHLVYDPAFGAGPKIDFRNRVAFKRLAPVLENVIYRIVQEGLTNARNHSQSKKILVSLKQRGDRLRIEICDWGVGFDPNTVMRNHFGLEGIRERARLLGGKCRIRSKCGEGTSVTVDLPVVERQQEE